MNWKKSVIIKKARRYGTNFVRPIIRKVFKGPIVLANSYPKSGTHLLTQILEPLDQTDYGNFIASTPSFSMKENSNVKMCHKISQLMPGELVSGHMFYSDEIDNLLFDKEIIHYFIYRDPRDVAVSEAHYLSKMNKWHKLHPYFKRLTSETERINLSINGIISDDFYYPDIGQRMARYSPWLKSSNVFAVKFEDLIGEKKKLTITKMFQFYVNKTGHDFDIEELVQNSINAIEPKKSHTFRIGKSGEWKNCFSEENLILFNKYASQEINNWGYP